MFLILFCCQTAPGIQTAIPEPTNPASSDRDSTTDAETQRIVIEVFQEMHDGFSCDEILLADDLQRAFVDGCRVKLPNAQIEDLNLTLLRLRKEGKLSAFKTSQSRRVSLVEVQHVAEIAARMLQDKYKISLDRVMANPDFRAEFDTAARQIDPEIELYRVRKAAFQLRKARQLKPELITRIADWGRVITVHTVAEAKAQPDLIPEEPGIYLFRDATGYLYIGEAENLKHRLNSHFDESDRKSLAAYLQANSRVEITVEIHTFEKGSRIEELQVRRAYESELIRSRNPRFNIRP